MDTSTALLTMAQTIKKQQQDIENLKKMMDAILNEIDFSGIESKYQFV